MFKHIIASGCSFTSNGAGGLPPSQEHPEGACSYITDIDYQAIDPESWAGILAQNLNVKSFVNVAASSHGNFLIANNVLTLINRFNYNPLDTLILFNLSDPARIDIPCTWNEKTKSNRCDWSDHILPFKYISRDSVLIKQLVLTMGINQIEMVTSNAVLGMMNTLKQKKFNFYFTMMCNYKNHKYLGPVISQFNDHLVTLDPGVGMMEYAGILNLTSEDKIHPSQQGHRSISLQVLNKINEHIIKIYN
jgi:hypothetical protein